MIGEVGIAEVVLDTDVDRRVVHVVLDTRAVNDHEFADSVFSELKIGTEVHAPAKCVAAQVERFGGVGVNPRDLPEYAPEPRIAPVSNADVLPRRSPACQTSA